MGTTSVEFPFFVINNARSNGNSRFLSPKVEFSTVKFPSAVEFSKLNLKPSSTIVCCTSEEFNYQKHSASDEEKKATTILDTVESPLHLKNLSPKELRQLADDIRSELSFIMSKTLKPLKASLEVVELTVALHYVFHAPIDKILWDVEEHTYPHKLLTGRRATMQMDGETNDLSESIFDPIGTGHGCNSISAGLGMAVARDIKSKRDRVVAVISNQTTMAGQVYEAMSNAGYLDSDMIVILNDTRHSLKPKVEQVPKRSINALSSILSKVQSSKLFRRFRELAKLFTKRIGRGMHEWAAKVDEYARGLIGPPGSTLFEELGLYYIGPVDGHNIDDLICVLHEVAALDYMGPVLLHVITKQDEEPMPDQSTEVSDAHEEDSGKSHFMPSTVRPKTYTDCFVEALILEAERDKDIVVVHAGMGIEASLLLFKDKFPERFFEMGMAEQHAVTFAAGLSRGGLKPFCIIPSAFLQRAYDQVVHDVDRQKIPVRFVITSAGLVGFDGPVHTGAFDITYMSCLPNMIVMAPGNELELAHMVTTAAQINDGPVCFRYPRGAVAKITDSFLYGVPIEIGKGRVLIEGTHVALLGYGSMVQNCLRAQSILEHLGVNVTVADARFCKPLDINLIRNLCDNHSFLITVEEGAVGGFGSCVSQFISLDGQLDAGIKWRPITLPDTYIERASPVEQLSVAGLSGNHIAATTLSLLGRNREALLLLC